jgi:hypothetical protein
MAIKVLNFSEIQKTLDASGREPLDILAEKTGTTYVVAVTREKCSGCEKQKPLFERLSDRMKKKYDCLEFFRVNSSFNPQRNEETKQCADAFHTVAFPTYIIGVRDNEGNCRETYRSIEPPMSEIERNIKTGVEIATWFKQEKK